MSCCNDVFLSHLPCLLDKIVFDIQKKVVFMQKLPEKMGNHFFLSKIWNDSRIFLHSMKRSAITKSVHQISLFMYIILKAHTMFTYNSSNGAKTIIEPDLKKNRCVLKIFSISHKTWQNDRLVCFTFSYGNSSIIVTMHLIEIETDIKEMWFLDKKNPIDKKKPHLFHKIANI